MSVYKEELRDFIDIGRAINSFSLGSKMLVGQKGTHSLTNDLRDWMREMEPLRIDKIRIIDSGLDLFSSAVDSFFIAFEVDGERMNGVLCEIFTVKDKNGTWISTRSNNASFKIDIYDIYRFQKKEKQS